ncbi:MAG: molybdopterin-dependent oxidoreductase, partial [Candidatus Delongbacteria bacterium]|nr:molybdopterin-dependent oxidoreductase [Candidatus Delongbacteria bacterium]
GTDVALLNGIMHEILKNGWEDKEYIEKRVELDTYEEVKITLEKYTPEYSEKITGVPAEDIRKMAKLFGKAKVGAVYFAMGITQHITGVDNVKSIANLQLICGNVGIVGGGINPLRGQSNVQGASDAGGLPNVYSGYRKVDDKNIHAEMSKFWDSDLSDKRGLEMTLAFDKAYDGDMKAFYIMGENPVLSDPDITHIRKAFDNLEFIVVEDIFMTETAKLADVILPASTYAEKRGTFTNTDRRVQLLNKAVNSPGDTKDDWEIHQLIANKIGLNWSYKDQEEIFNEFIKCTPQYGGMTYERLEGSGLQWPCPTKDHPGTPILHVGEFVRGLAKMHPITYKDPAELPDEEYPIYLTTGRVLQHFHTGAMTRKTKGLNNLSGPHVMISVEDAENLGISNGEKIKVTTRRGSITTIAFVTKRMPKGTASVPLHFWEAPANMLTNNALDPISKIPEFKVAACKLEKA